MDPGFYQKLLQVSSDVQMKPEDLLNVMVVESGIDPTAHNTNGNASGLIQFMPSTLKGLGFQGSHADFRQMSSVDQLDYVKKYILGNMKYNGGPFTSAAQYYVANFLPVALQLPGVKNGDPNTIIVAKNPNKPHLPGVSAHMESVYYNSNPILDADHDGVITYGDIQTVLNRAAGGKNFRSALAQLQNATGYQPSKELSKAPPSMVATNVRPTNNIMSILDSYLQEIAASDRSNKKIYKKYLPQQQLVIQVSAPNYADAVEFSHILTAALNEELLATAFTHTDGQQVEVECRIHGPQADCFYAVQQLTNIVADAFTVATKKVGSLQVKNKLFMNKKSSYQPISLEAYDTQHRKFLLKFI
jgi:Transglycosylase SLT domain